MAKKLRRLNRDDLSTNSSSSTATPTEPIKLEEDEIQVTPLEFDEEDDKVIVQIIDEMEEKQFDLAKAATTSKMQHTLFEPSSEEEVAALGAVSQPKSEDDKMEPSSSKHPPLAASDEMKSKDTAMTMIESEVMSSNDEDLSYNRDVKPHKLPIEVEKKFVDANLNKSHLNVNILEAREHDTKTEKKESTVATLNDRTGTLNVAKNSQDRRKSRYIPEEDVLSDLSISLYEKIKQGQALSDQELQDEARRFEELVKQHRIDYLNHFKKSQEMILKNSKIAGSSKMVNFEKRDSDES